MAFVASTTGNDTDNGGVHQFLWMRCANDRDALDLLAWQPWLQTTTINDRVLLKWADVAALNEEVRRTGADARGLNPLANPPGAAYLATSLKAATKDVTKVSKSRAQGAAGLQTAVKLFSAEQVAAVTMSAADTVLRPTAGTPAWQTHLTYGLIDESGTGPKGLGTVFFYDDNIRLIGNGAVNGLQSLEDVRRRAERAGRLELIAGWAPYPAAAPVPLPPDSVDRDTAAYAVAELLGSTGYTQVALRSSAARGPARNVAWYAELEGMLKAPDGDTPEMRKRARDCASVVAENVELLLGDGTLTTADVTAAILAGAAACRGSCPTASAQLITPEGLSAMHRGLTTFAAWLCFPEVASLPLHEKVIALNDRAIQLGLNAGVGGVGLNAGGGGGGGGGSGGGGGGGGGGGYGTNASGFLSRCVAAANEGPTAEVMHEVEPMLADPKTRSRDVHERIFRARTKRHPNRRPSGLLHAMGFGIVNAGSLNPNWALIHTFSTDECIGEYVAVMIVEYMVRARLYTPAQAERLKGASLSALVAVLRTGDWSKIDVPNMVLWPLAAHLARASGQQPPPKTKACYVYADPVVNARVPGIVGCIFEAFGMQKQGEGSLRDIFEEANAGLAGNTHFPAAAMAALLVSNQKMWQGCLKEAGALYHPCRSGANARAELPTVNVRSGPGDGPRQAHDQLLTDMLDTVHRMGLQAKLQGGANHTGNELNAAALSIILKSDKGSGGDVDLAPQFCGTLTPEREESDRKAALAAEQLAKTKESNAKAIAAYESAGQGQMLGTPEKAVYKFGPTKWDVTAARKAWPGKCVPAICADSCKKGHGYGMQACPADGEDGHCDSGAAHKLDKGMPKPATFRIGTPEAGKGKGKAKDAGKGKGRPSGGRGNAGAKKQRRK